MKKFLPLLLTSLMLSGSLTANWTLPAAAAVKLAEPAEQLPVDNCTFYLTTYALENPDQIHQLLPAAQLAYLPDRDNWSQLKISYGTQIVTLTRQSNPTQVGQQKLTYQKLLPALDNDRNLVVTQDLGRKSNQLKQMITVRTLDPTDPDWSRLISSLAQLWHSTVLYRDEVLDPRLRVLLARDDDWETGSQIPYFDSALARKSRNEQILLQRKIPILKNLAPIVSEEELAPQAARQVMERAVTLLILASSTTTITRAEAGDMLNHWGLIHELTPSERTYLTTPEVAAEDEAKMNLRFESAYALLWALGVTSGTPFPGQLTDLKGLIARVKGRNFNVWFDQARLRPRSEILNQLDLAYRLSWAKKQANAQDYKPLQDLQGSLLQEWYYALSWLANPTNGWDKVKTE